MGILDKIFPRKPKQVSGAGFQTFTERQPFFSSWDGTLYEQELTRAVIERFASACSKLEPEITGNSKPSIVRLFRTTPNTMMTWPQFLARIATVVENDNTAAVIPAYASDMQTVVGLFPLKFEIAEVLEVGGEPWIRFYLASGEKIAIELSEVCLITRFQYLSDYFGTDGGLESTLKLIQAQDEAQENAIRNGASIRFIGALSGQVREEDMKKKRERFISDNLTVENESGLMLYDQTFQDIRQVDSKNYTIDPSEMERIQRNVFNYFGTNENILQNSYDENQWAAYYEGKVEPFAVQLGEGLTKMLFTPRERINNKITFSSSRLAYSSNASKRNMIRDMLDRGVLTINQALEILQLPPVEDGDVRILRGEYINAKSVSEVLRQHDNGDIDKGDKERNSYDDPNSDTEEDKNTEA